MWSALFGYSKPLSEALAERLFLLLVLAPWWVLLAGLPQGQAAGSGARRIFRPLVFVLILDRLLAEFAFWAPITAIVAGFWRALGAQVASFSHQTSLPRVRGIARWLLVSLMIASLAVWAPAAVAVRLVLVLWIVLAIYGDRATGSGTAGELRESPCWHRIGFYLLVSGLFLLGIQGIRHSTFLVMLVFGIAGWMSLKFVCWRRLRSGPRRPVLIRIASAGAGVLAAVLMTLLLAECYFRYLHDASDSNDGLRTVRRWQARHVRINSWGYRDREFPGQADLERTRRVLVLGDSFAYGWGISAYEDMLGPQLERALRDKRGSAVEVFTIATPGIDTVRETALFERDGRRLSPQVVVVAYHLNDIDRGQTAGPHPGVAFTMWKPLEEGSDFIELLDWHLYEQHWGVEPHNPLRQGLSDYGDEAVFSRQAAHIRALVQAIRTAGARPVFMLFPFLNVAVKEGPQRHALDLVSHLLRDENVAVLDVTGVVDVNERRYRANLFDPHPSAELHRALVPQLVPLVVDELKPVTLSTSRP